MHVRTAAALLGTAGSLALLLSFKTPSTVGTTNRPAAGAAPPASTSPETSALSAAAPAAQAPSAGSKTTDGPTVSTRYGPVQVQVDTSGGRITDVVALKLPSDRSRSAEISDYAGPILHDEVVQAQSAKIDVVSGATYTSEAYAKSLQAVLDGHA
jgi:uncharacterized protein with FMN-binding domain